MILSFSYPLGLLFPFLPQWDLIGPYSEIWVSMESNGYLPVTWQRTPLSAWFSSGSMKLERGQTVTWVLGPLTKCLWDSAFSWKVGIILNHVTLSSPQFPQFSRLAAMGTKIQIGVTWIVVIGKPTPWFLPRVEGMLKTSSWRLPCGSEDWKDWKRAEKLIIWVTRRFSIIYCDGQPTSQLVQNLVFDK